MVIIEPGSLQTSHILCRSELKELILESQLLENVDSDVKPDVNELYSETPADIVADAIHDLASYNDCLMDLSSVIGSLPFSDGREKSTKPPRRVSINFEALPVRTRMYCEAIEIAFPNLSPHLVQRLGEANARRDRRLFEPRRLQKRSKATGHDDTHITKSLKPTHPSFLDRNPTEWHETDDQILQTSLATFSTKPVPKKSTSGRGGRSRVPKVPELFDSLDSIGQESQCRICGQTSTPFATRSEWK